MWERDGRVQKVRVPDEGLTIGRKPPPYGASYCTTNSAVSRLHCRLARLGDGWFIEDLGSANGTLINGELAEGPTPLGADDVVLLGGDEQGLKLTLARPAFDDAQTHVAQWRPIEKVRSSYDIVAEKYATELADDMVARPLERGMLLAFGELVGALGDGVVGDIGCGPGHIAKHLATLGVRTVGIDVSAAMIEQAKHKFPAGEFRVGSMYELPVADDAWLGAVSLYATLHSNADERALTFRELHRAVVAGGYLLHSFYISAPDQPEGSVYHLQKWFGHQVDLHTYFVGIEAAAGELDDAGFEVLAALVREPMTTGELPARRCYMLGRATGR